MRCCDCGQDELTENEIAVSDGSNHLCEQCARWHSNRIFNNVLRVFEEEEEIYRKAFAKYGIDDFAYCVDEELEK